MRMHNIYVWRKLRTRIATTIFIIQKVEEMFVANAEFGCIYKYTKISILQ